ncbi:MAG: diguanylate cyclase [Pseudomonadota bacterium]
MLSIATPLPQPRQRRSRFWLDATALVLVMAAVMGVAWLADSGMARIRDGLAAELFEQSRDIAALERALDRAESSLRGAQVSPPGRHEAQAALREVGTALLGMRRAYSFDSVEGASAAHALVHPVLLDVERWISEGVPGYPADGPVVWRLAHQRSFDAVEGLRTLRAEVSERARQLLAEESLQVEKLRLQLVVAIFAVAILIASYALAVIRQRDAQIRASRERGRLLNALNSVPHGVALFDASDELLLANEPFKALFPGDAARVTPGQSFAHLNSAIEHARRASCEDGEWRNEPLSPRAVAGPILAERDDGRFLQLETRVTDEGGTVLVQSDVTARRAREQRLRHLATHDALTGLPGRRHFDQRLRQALNAAERSNRQVSLMLIDVDNFKQINDTLGHPAGDAVLACIAERLRQSVRDHDIVARLGGDEFAVVMENTGSTVEALVSCERIFANVARPVDTPGGQVSGQSVSIGVALYPTHAASREALVRAADAASYEAKRAGRNRVAVFGD